MAKYRYILAKSLFYDAQAGVSLKLSSRIDVVTGTKKYA